MMDENAFDSQNLTFSQAQGYERLPQPLKLEELPDGARTKFWSCLYDFVKFESSGYSVGGNWRMILANLHVMYYELALDEFEDSLQSFVNVYKPKFMHDPFNKVFDLLQAIMRQRSCPHDFIQALAAGFEHCRLAYVVDTKDPFAIYPATTKEEARAVLRATNELRNAGLAGAVIHLQQSSDCINQGDYAGAVRESIHAVESTARQIDPNAKSLESALNSLEKSEALHLALKRAFSSLYGYASDEQGIRHALIDSPQPNVGQDEAVFMFGACASFSSYLARKHRQSTS